MTEVNIGLAKMYLQRAGDLLSAVQYLEKLNDSDMAPQLAKVLMANALNEIETGTRFLGIEIMVPSRGDEL